jgi:hypothetical protein
MLSLIGDYTNHNGVPVLIEFFIFNMNEYEYQANLYTVTRSYLKLVDSIFSKDHPFEFLTP